jgi:hypothetical protein
VSPGRHDRRAGRHRAGLDGHRLIHAAAVAERVESTHWEAVPSEYRNISARVEVHHNGPLPGEGGGVSPIDSIEAPPIGSHITPDHL